MSKETAMSNRVKRVSKPSPSCILEEFRNWDIDGGEIVILLVGEDARIDPETLIHTLRASGFSFAGAIVPAVIEGSQLYPSDVLMLRCPVAGAPIVVGDLNKKSFSLPAALDRFLESHAADGCTLLILTDGLARGLSRLLGLLWKVLGNRVSYIGGGATYSDLVQRPCLFTEHGAFDHAALIIPIQMRVRLGTRHGWAPLGPTMIATRTVDNIIHEINWTSAFDVYRDVLESVCGVKATRENFATVAVEHPLGLIREDGEELVRDPIALAADDSLICVGGVRENSALRVMHGSPENLIRAAASVARDVLAELPCQPMACFVADCVSRRQYLGKQFADELSTMAQSVNEQTTAVPLVGFLSFGEIASPKTGWLDLYNKTVVMAVLHERSFKTS